MVSDCIFCKIDPTIIVARNTRMLAFKDRHPVTDGHMLIIPEVHRADFFELTHEEVIDLDLLIRKLRDEISNQDASVTGFNIGMNCGKSAGQTVFHCHVHLIPRRAGDCENPTGGVRGVIPSKQRY